MAAAETGIVKAATSSSDSETCVTNLPGDAQQQAAAAADEGKNAKPAGPKRMKLMRVRQDFIDSILEYRKVNPRRRGPIWHEEMMVSIYKDPEALERCRSVHAKAVAMFKSTEEMHDGILKQYNANGSAFMEVEIADDDEKSSN